MPSGSSPVRETLAGYVAGRVNAERLVIAVTAAYYGDTRRGTRDGLGPLIDLIDRASPGIVELGTVQGGVGFDIRLVERPFPKEYEAELRGAVERLLSNGASAETGHGEGAGPAPAPSPGLLARVVAAVRRLFRASA